MINTAFKNVTDERLVIDVLAPGFNKETVTVKTARVGGGEVFKVVVEGKYAGRKNKNGDPIPRLGFEKVVEDFKLVLSDDAAYGDVPLYRSRTFTSADYNLDGLVWDAKDGVIRISIPKTSLARGKLISATDNADADSTGVVTSDAVANDAADDAANN